ncbi:hypothetical protein ACLKA7_004383 [Drosophila subpalustris]
MQMRGEDAAATGVSNTLFAVQLLQRQDEHEKLQKEQQECKSISMRPARTCVNWAESCCRLRMHSTASAPCRCPSGGETQVQVLPLGFFIEASANNLQPYTHRFIALTIVPNPSPNPSPCCNNATSLERETECQWICVPFSPNGASA